MRIFLSLIFLFTTVTLSAQGTAKLKGLIKNPISDSIYVTYNNGTLIYDPVMYNGTLNEGRFEYTLKLQEPFTPIIIKHGKLETELILQPGDDLALTAFVNDTAWSVSYTGKGSAAASFAAAHETRLGKLDRYPSKMQPYLKSEPETFMVKMDSMEKEELAFLELHKSGLPKPFVQYWSAMVRYFTYYCRLQYPFMKEVAKNKGYNFSSIPKENYITIKGIPETFNDTFLPVAPYRLYTDLIYRMQLQTAGYVNDTLDMFRVEDSIARLALKNMPPATAEYVTALQLYSRIRTLPAAFIEGRIEQFKKRWPKSAYLTNLQSQLAIVKRLSVGEKAFDFTINTPQGKTAKLSDFKGKYILLGFWSSEYRQSITEMRAAAQMANKYKDIAFIYVSLDKDNDAWVKAIEANKLQGIHTREEGGWKAMLAQLYGIQALPTFFLIDKEGKFAVQQTPYPSQAGLMVKVVEDMLNK